MSKAFNTFQNIMKFLTLNLDSIDLEDSLKVKAILGSSKQLTEHILGISSVHIHDKIN